MEIKKDTRWTLLATLIVGAFIAFRGWSTTEGNDDWRIAATMCCFAMTIVTAVLVLAMLAGRRRNFIPKTTSGLLAVVAAVAALATGMGLRAAYRHGLFFMLVGCTVAAVAAERLWRRACLTEQRSAAALAAVDRELAIAAGDLVVRMHDNVDTL